MPALREYGSGAELVVVNRHGFAAADVTAPVMGTVLFGGFLVKRILAEDPIRDLAWWAGAFVLALWCVRVVANASLVVRENALCVRNWFSEHWVPWQSVAELQADMGKQLTIVLTDGRRLPVRSGGGELAVALRSSRSEIELGRRIQQLREAAAATATGATVRRRIVSYLPALLVLCGAFAGLLPLLGVTIPSAAW